MESPQQASHRLRARLFRSLPTFRQRPLNNAPGPSAPLEMRNISIHYKYAFDVGRTVDLKEAATRLLATDLGVVAVTQHQTWDAARLATIKTLKRDYERLQEAIRRAPQGAGRFASYLALHPSLLPLLWRARRSHQHSTDTPPDLGLDDVEQQIAEQSKLQALFRSVDADIFNPDFLGGDPWVRIELQPVFASDSTNHYAIDVALVLHRTGTALLSFYISYDGPVSPAQLAALSISSGVSFNQTEVAAWVGETYATQHAGWQITQPDAERFSSGIRWARWQHDHPASLADIFDLYRVALLSSINAARPERPRSGVARSFATQWTAYPIVCVRHPDPRSFDRADADAQAQLGTLVARGTEGTKFRTDFLISQADEDLSLTEGQRYWVNGALTVLLVGEDQRARMVSRRGGNTEIPGQDWIALEQYVAAPLEFLLMRYHTAHALVAQLNSVALAASHLHKVKARVLAAKMDFDAPSRFTYGSLQSMWAAFHKDRGTSRAWDLVNETLMLVDGVLDAEDRSAGARRSFSLQVVLGVITVVLGIPALHRAVEILGALDTQPHGAYAGFGRLVNSVSALAETTSGPLVVSLTLVLVAFVCFALAAGHRRKEDRAPLATRAQGRAPDKEPFQYFPGGNFTYIPLREPEE